jgi:HD-GYP domain-containing protein (c-di-GMP phosphodiesterase class II)
MPWTKHLKSQAGIHFDPEILDVFLSNYEEIQAVAEEKGPHPTDTALCWLIFNEFA